MRHPELKTLSLDRFIEFLGDKDTLPVDKAYQDVAWFRRGIDIRTAATHSYPFDMMRGDEVIVTEAPDTQIDLDPRLDIFNLLDDISADLDLYGCFYAIYETNAFNRNGAWRRLHPKTIQPQYDQQTGELIGFKRQFKSTAITFDVDELLYIWMPNRSAEQGYGYGVGHSALHAATALNNTTLFQKAFFENGALSPTIVTIDGFETFRQDEQERVKGVFQRMIGGVKRAFNIIPVSGNTTVSTLMQPLNEMAMDSLTTQQREDVSTALGVPHSLLFSNAANFATATQDTLNFYDLAITPHVRMIQRQLNERLFEPLGVRIDFKPERLEVYQVLEAQKADRLAILFDRNVITLGEFREQMGLPPIEEVDDYEEESPQDDMDERLSRLEAQEDSDDEGEQEQDEAPPVRSALIDDLDKWKRLATKRYDEGTPHKALDFTSDAIPPTLHSIITNSLQVADSKSTVGAIFNDATAWEHYA